jgi:serine/threonine protein phosphatase PrpC
MRSVDAEKIRVEVRSGDFIIMLSDGICQGGDEAPWLLELISKYDGRSPKELADRIIAEAGKHTAYGDDMSVVTVKISAE